MSREISVERIVDAIDAVTWYNDIAEMVDSWLNLPVWNALGSDHQIIQVPNACSEDEQLEFIWMILVMLFGDYSTSPRSGWIEDIDGFKNFIQQITKSWREYKELERYDD